MGKSVFASLRFRRVYSEPSCMWFVWEARKGRKQCFYLLTYIFCSCRYQWWMSPSVISVVSLFDGAGFLDLWGAEEVIERLTIA